MIPTGLPADSLRVQTQSSHLKLIRPLTLSLISLDDRLVPSASPALPEIAPSAVSHSAVDDSTPKPVFVGINMSGETIFSETVAPVIHHCSSVCGCAACWAVTTESPHSTAAVSPAIPRSSTTNSKPLTQTVESTQSRVFVAPQSEPISSGQPTSAVVTQLSIRSITVETHHTSTAFAWMASSDLTADAAVDRILVANRHLASNGDQSPDSTELWNSFT